MNRREWICGIRASVLRRAAGSHGRLTDIVTDSVTDTVTLAVHPPRMFWSTVQLSHYLKIMR
jgi:hypothetical protein